ncbi:ferroxidase FET5 [Nakaseomyces bracarensis]|uniref:ferroxidase FET5 n=1 Tax=Nakaseomyces bracarensis TaxID=273131 RepID=UPI003871F06E
MVFLLLWACILGAVSAKVHTFHFTADWVDHTLENGVKKKMIGFNGEWPLPDIHVNKGDRVELYLTNGFNDDTKTSLHFHGLSHNTSHGNEIQRDGPSMVTQCPLVSGQTYLYNFTVSDQVGTYWYHAHEGSQYGDGFRAAFIIHDEDEPFNYDEEMTISVADLYYEPYYEIKDSFLSRYNPTGAEPIPKMMLFNNAPSGEIHFEPGKTYLLRIINMGLFVSQYLGIEDHVMTIVEVDGVYTKPNKTELIYIAAGQRMSVLVEAKVKSPQKNFAFMQILDETMLDMVDPELQLNVTNQVIYDNSKPLAAEIYYNDLDLATNEFYLQPFEDISLFEKYDKQIILDVRMKNLGDGVKYAFFNNITYVSPKVPSLTTALTSGKLAIDPRIYGDNINVFVLEPNEIVEIVLNNYDPGKHPFHLHGHNFQLVQKSPGFHLDENFDESEQDSKTVRYNESAPLMDFPAHPVMRDTIVLEPNGHAVLRFRADNPGVWIFHCHVDWHLEQGLAAIFVESPLILQERETLSQNYLDVCSAAGMPNKGNAAGISEDWLDLTGLPRQPKPLPKGFTTKGYVAFIICTLVGIWGLYSISDYGFSEVIQDDREVFDSLKAILDSNAVSYTLDEN